MQNTAVWYSGKAEEKQNPTPPHLTSASPSKQLTLLIYTRNNNILRDVGMGYSYRAKIEEKF